MSLLLSPKMKNLLSSQTKTRSLDYKLSCIFANAGKNTFKPRKVKARAGEMVLKGRSENFVVDVEEMKTE
jgi:hypothetical protein